MPLPDRAPTERTLMRDEAYRTLRSLIVAGTLAPAERLRDKDLASWLGVSRTPVREALTRLADDGLIEMAPNRYTRVTPLRLQDAVEGYPLAAALHALAAELAASAASDELLDELEAEAERYGWAMLRDDDAEMVASDDAFHAALIGATGSRQLVRQVERVVPRLRQIELNLGRAIGARRPDVHRELIGALRSGDAPAASLLVEGEWREVARLVLSAQGRSAPAILGSQGRSA